MEDHRREFQLRALKNVRALLDKLEAEPAEIPARAIVIVGVIIAAGALVVAAAAMVTPWYKSRAAEPRRA